MSLDPITGVGVVASRNRAPTGYDVISTTTDGLDADLWKDGLFKSKVTRYLCFTRVFSKENREWKHGRFSTADMSTALHAP
ncbi:Multivesicular body subunit 12B [Ataeniobius toweri]|uniref:Multivesicular body subunit 12B n=1 Tax=Ataeniobius toweri TaxID=208326 RepID=A0ABU7A769_9TELE|nr:Multivesicular body subunit 12B [Ataeniobius toweri]